jgi:hypothetical protein
VRRIIIIGNSHVGALKLGWDLCAGDYPGTEVTFFAVPGSNFAEMRLGPGRRFGLPDGIDPESPALKSTLKVNGATAIDLSAADHVVWAGYEWRQSVLASLLVDHDIDGIREAGAGSLMSRAAFDAVCAAMAANMVPGRAWHDWTAPDLYILARPVPSEDCLQVQEGGKRGRWHRALRDGTPFGPALDAYFDAAARVFADRGIVLMRPPVSVRAPSGFTQAHFSRGSIRLGNRRPHPDEDLQHMNAAYGVTCLRILFEAFDHRSQPAAQPRMSATTHA